MRYVVVLLAALAAAAPADKDKRRVHERLVVDLPWKHLRLAGGMKAMEGPQSLGDHFPFLVVTRGAGKEGHVLTPENLDEFIKGPIANERQAREAARTFIAGPYVKSKEASERVVDVARAAPRYLGVTVHDYRPGEYKTAVTKDGDAFKITFVALETYFRARLVHVTATVQASGAVAYEFKPLVDGPQLSWQTGRMSAKGQAANARRQAQVADVLLRYMKALQGKPTRGTVWAASRALHERRQVEALLGEPQRVEARQVAKVHYFENCTYSLTDGSTLTFVYPRSVKESASPAFARVRRETSVHQGGTRVVETQTYSDNGKAP